MALITEDGTGKVDAESYCDVVSADDYHSKRNNTSWAALTEPVKEACLRNATEYMVARYRMLWLGYRNTPEQALDWPRTEVAVKDFQPRGYDGYGLIQVQRTIVPVIVKNACAELALRASISALSEDLSQQVIEETVGPITVRYDKDSKQAKRYPQIENMLSIYLRGQRGPMVGLVRC